MKNYLHFPAKYQGKDNVRSIFDEHSFKHIPREYLKIFEEHEKLKADPQEIQSALTLEKDTSLKLKAETSLPSPKDDSANKTSLSPTQQSQSDGYIMIEPHKSDPDSAKIKPEIEQSKLMQFLYQYKYIAANGDNLAKLFAKTKEDPKDLINTFNNLVNSNTSENTDQPHPLYLFLEDGTIISLLDTANKEEKAINSKLIIRNITGKYAWNFEHIKGIVDANFTKRNLTINDIVADQFYTNFAMRLDDEDSEKKDEKMPSLDLEQNKSNKEEEEKVDSKTDEFMITEPGHTTFMNGKRKLEPIDSSMREPQELIDKFEEILNRVKEEVENFSQVLH